MGKPVHHQPAKPNSKQTSRQRQRHGLAHEKSQHAALGKAQRLEHRHFARPLADRHRHGVGRYQKRREHHRRADAQDERFHVAHHGDELQSERFLALRLGGLWRIAKHVIHCAGNFAYVTRRRREDTESASLSLEERYRFFDVLSVEVDRLVVRVRVINTANVQFKIDRIDRSLQDDAISQLPPIFGGERIVDDDALTVALPRCNLVSGHLGIPINFEKFIRIGAELREKILRLLIFVDSAKP